MDVMQQTAIRYANSMEVFTGSDETFVWGEWRDWKSACEAAGKFLDPSEFKKKKQ